MLIWNTINMERLLRKKILNINFTYKDQILTVSLARLFICIENIHNNAPVHWFCLLGPQPKSPYPSLITTFGQAQR